MFKRIKILVIVFLIIIGFSSCKKEGAKVAFLLPNMQSGRYLKERVYFTDKVKELGGTAVIVSAEYDENLQIKQAHDLIDQGVKVLVVNAINANTAAAIVREAQSNGVAVIAYDRLIRNCDLNYFLSFDNEKVGKLMAEYALMKKPEGKYILLGGDKADQNAIWVKKGQNEVLTPYIKSGKIKIVYDIFVEDWSGENARHDMELYFNLSSSDLPDAILSSYDGMSTGVINLLTEKGQAGNILITGQDAEIEACRNIVNGKQSMTVYKSVKQLAYKAAEMAMSLANGQNVQGVNAKTPNGQIDVPSILLDPQTVDASNLKSTVVADGFLSEKEIYQ
jgi:D-xylose transport system substrate-binding protein